MRAVFLLFVGMVVSSHAEMYCGSSNCYALLGVERDATLPAIKKAFRGLSLQWHPDKNPDKKEEATVKFRQIATAYEVLSDGDVREAYNHFLDHPEEHFQNMMRYYRAVYQPKTPVWAVIVGLVLVISGLQCMHFRERARSFEASPLLKTMLEEEYLRNCSRGRQGYQSGELDKAAKAEIRRKFLEELAEDPDCPLSKSWKDSLLIQLVYGWPVGLARWAKWRIAHADEIRAERDREAEERQREEEELRQEEEALEKESKRKEEQRAAKAKLSEERRQQEEEKRKRWAEEAQREAEEQAAAENEVTEDSLHVMGKVAAVDEMRKKGYFLIEVRYGDDESVFIVTNKTVAVGQEVGIALDGATLANGERVKRTKVAGEWSEAALEKIGSAPYKEDGGVPENGDPPCEEVAEEEDESASKARKRKNKKG